jgi:hypothetical protein
MTAPELLQREMPLVRRVDVDLAEHGYIKGSDEYRKMFDDMLKFHRWFGWTVKPQGVTA